MMMTYANTIRKRTAPIVLMALGLLAATIVARPANVQAQSTGDAARPAGTEFYVGFMLNEDKRGAVQRFMGLMITSEVTTTADVELPGSPAKQYTIQPGQVTTIPVSRTLEMRYGEEPPLPAVHITSRAPISVYVMNSLYQSTGGYAAIPVDLWGQSYMPLSLPNADGERVCEFMVIAAYEGTILTITPSAQTNYKEPGQDITKSLHKGEAYLVQARNVGVGTTDLSVSEIRASHPVGVVAGHMRAPITENRTMPIDKWASHFATMMMPDNRWGNQYYTVPTRAGSDRFRMTAALDNTIIHITHMPIGGAPESATVTLDRGELYDSTTINGKPITGPVHWSASGPILLMQMRTSGAYGNAENSPAVFQAAPTDQFGTMTAFCAPQFIGSSTITSQQVTIIAKGNGALAPTDATNPINTITVDGKPIATIDAAAAWNRIEGDYFFTRIAIAGGGHVIRSQDNYPFTAMVAGNSGSFGDFYSFQAPYWMPRTEGDFRAPFVVNTISSAQEGWLIAQISDKTNSYFSGVADVKVLNSPGWRLAAPFTAPAPDDDISV